MKKGIIRALLFVTLVVLAIVLGKAAGSAAGGIPYLSWLAIAAKFGVSTVTVDLAVLTLTFGLIVDINVAQAILLLAAIFTYIRIQGKG
jgi:hypothetical protein